MPPTIWAHQKNKKALILPKKSKHTFLSTVQPKQNKRISRSAAARQNESMPRQSLKPHQYAAASHIFAAKLHICPPRHAAIRDMMPSRCAS
ncbi:hypothetical protein DPMN_020166 [Dreissena polymorpha]|uniref:Uncharacterized protein n=1 Tax=Dreissena polymorpha TaxID=45954 RepID=A0A9D4S8U2_DREPO|nr:hypothetical protein DPMN_020166 [Dreissena polymorpha]